MVPPDPSGMSDPTYQSTLHAYTPRVTGNFRNLGRGLWMTKALCPSTCVIPQPDSSLSPRCDQRILLGLHRQGAPSGGSLLALPERPERVSNSWLPAGSSSATRELVRDTEPGAPPRPTGSRLHCNEIPRCLAETRWLAVSPKPLSITPSRRNVFASRTHSYQS